MSASASRQLAYRTLWNLYEQVCRVDVLPKQTLPPAKAIFCSITYDTLHFTKKIDTAITYHIQGAKSCCDWWTKKPNYTCMMHTAPPHFLTGRSSNEPQHMRQASDLNVEWMLQKGGPGRIPERRATGVYGFYCRGQRSRAVQYKYKMLCGNSTRNRSREQKKSCYWLTASCARTVSLFH